MRQRVVGCLFAVLALSVGTGAGAAEAATRSRTISVSGTAASYAPPDSIHWNVVLETTQKTMMEAKKASDAQVKAFLELMQQKQIAPSDIDTGLVIIKDAPATEESAQGITVTRTLSLRQRGLAGFGEMLKTLNTGIRGNMRYKFVCTRLPEITKETMIRAVLAAREKAATMAKVLDAKLGQAITISEYPPANWTAKDEDVPVDVPAATFSADAKQVTVTVFATFELE